MTKIRKNGGKGTFFGNLWRGIVKNNIPMGEEIVAAIDGGNPIDVAKAITKDKDIPSKDKEMMLADLKQDVIEMQEITKRWESDNLSDSWFSKNTRPLTLIFLTVSMVFLILLDSFNIDFGVNSEWIDLLKSLLITVYVAYFGSRGVEKFKSIGK